MSLRGKVKALSDARRSRVRERSSLGEATRERLLQVARQLFAERGYHHVTVRDISRLAGANLAAIGYHFGDKLNLYRTVTEHEIANIRQLNQRMNVAEGSSAEAKIREYIHAYLPRMIQPEAHVEWFQRLIRHEMAEPTPIAHEIAEKVFRPRVQYLAELVAEALDCDLDDRRVQHSVFSIQAQCMFYVRDSFRSLVFENWFPQSPDEIRAAADHIADFSIAGMRALSRPRGRPKQSGARAKRRAERAPH